MFNSTYVVLAGGDPYSLENVQCYFDDEAEINKLAEVSKGSQITIIGNIEGKSVYVDVKHCKMK